MLLELARRDGVSLGGKLTDCGTMVFDNDKQDVHAGGSGCGCSAITLCGYLLGQLNGGKLKKILFCGTGALLSPTSTQQGLPIPGSVTQCALRRKRNMDYVKAFLIGGLLCLIGQILIDKTKLTPARILVSYVVIGVLLGAVGVYQPLAEFAGAGASVPLTGFGNTLAKGRQGGGAGRRFPWHIHRRAESLRRRHHRRHSVGTDRQPDFQSEG